MPCQACVEFVEYTGSELYLHCAGVSEKMFTIRGASVSKVQRGEKVTVKLDMDMAHLFSQDTGENILHQA